MIASRLRIAVLTSTYPHGSSIAAAPFLAPFLDELRGLGHEPVAFFPRIAATAPSSAVEVPIEWTGRPRPLIGLSPSRPRDLALLLRLLRRWQRRVAAEHAVKPFDIALALWAVPAGLVARRLYRSLGLPYSVWTLGSDMNVYGRRMLSRRLVRLVLRDAGAVFANSNALAGEVQALTGREAEFLATTRPIQPPARAAALPEGVNFLFVGRLEEVKGPDVLLEAAQRLAAGSGGWHLTIVGDGSMSAGLREQVLARPTLAGRVTFTGHLDGEQFLSYLYASDCIVISSRAESMPVVFSEGIQAAKGFIVTDVGDLGELVRTYDLGEVVAPGDSTALAEAMKRFIDSDCGEIPIDDELLRLFDISRSAERFCEVAGEVLNRPSRTGTQ